MVEAATDGNCTAQERQEYQKVGDQDIIEMGGFCLPGTNGSEEKKQNFQWKFGRQDGQFKVILGHNTVWKPVKQANSKDPETGINFL